MPIDEWKEQGEVTGVKDEARADDIPVGSVSTSSPAGFHLNDDPVAIVKGVDLVRHSWTAVVPEKHGATNLAGRRLARLDLEPGTPQPGSEVLKNRVAREPDSRIGGGDIRLGVDDEGDEVVDPRGRSNVAWVVVPCGEWSNRRLTGRVPVARRSS
jgi:hypothetical protein